MIAKKKKNREKDEAGKAYIFKYTDKCVIFAGV